MASVSVGVGSFFLTKKIHFFVIPNRWAQSVRGTSASVSDVQRSLSVLSQTLATRLTEALKVCHVRRKQTHMRVHPETKQLLMLDPFELLFPVEALLLQKRSSWGSMLQDFDINQHEGPAAAPGKALPQNLLTTKITSRTDQDGVFVPSTAGICYREDDWDTCTRRRSPHFEFDREAETQALQELQAAFEKMTAGHAFEDGLDSVTWRTYTLVALRSSGVHWAHGNFDDFAEAIGRVATVSILIFLNGNDHSEGLADHSGVLDALAFRPAISVSAITRPGSTLSDDDHKSQRCFIPTHASGLAYLQKLEGGLDAFAAGAELMNAFSMKALEGPNFANVRCFDKNSWRIDRTDASKPAGVVLVGLKSFDSARLMPGGASPGDACVPEEWAYSNTTMDHDDILVKMEERESKHAPRNVYSSNTEHLIARPIAGGDASPADMIRLPMAWNSKATKQPLAIVLHRKPVYPEANFAEYDPPRSKAKTVNKGHIIDELKMFYPKKSLPSEMDLSFTVLPYVSIQVAAPMTERSTKYKRDPQGGRPKAVGNIHRRPAYNDNLAKPAAKEGAFTLAVSLKRRAVSASDRHRNVFCGGSGQKEEEQDDGLSIMPRTWEDETSSSYSLSIWSDSSSVSTHVPLSSWSNSEQKERTSRGRAGRIGLEMIEENEMKEENVRARARGLAQSARAEVYHYSLLFFPFGGGARNRSPRYSQNFALCHDEGRFSTLVQFNIGSEFNKIDAQGQKIEVGERLKSRGPPVHGHAHVHFLLEARSIFLCFCLLFIRPGILFSCEEDWYWTFYPDTIDSSRCPFIF